MSLTSIIEGIKDFCKSNNWVKVKIYDGALDPKYLQEHDTLGCEVGIIKFKHVDPNETYSIETFRDHTAIRLYLTGGRCSLPFVIKNEKEVEEAMQKVKNYLINHPDYRAIKK